MATYSYLMDHDLGLAPNPFGEYCTLAVCKPRIRSSSKLKIGDWIIGTGSKSLEKTTGRKLTDKLIYAMQISEIISLEDYFYDPRFQYKKPVMNGTLVAMYGDNFYHKDQVGKWVQEDSAHCNIDGTCHTEHLKKDTGGKNVLISEHFFYFGDTSPVIPENLLDICHTRQGHKKLADRQQDELITWLRNDFRPGIHGDPLNWAEHNQLRIFE